ncbi:hypothetical protein D3C76_1484570 [compost metagenome]
MMAVSSRVATAARMPRDMARPGSAASSAAELTCSMQMNIQMAKGTQAKTPCRLTDSLKPPAPSRLAVSSCGSMAPPNTSRVTAAIAPASRVTPRASPTPRIWMPMIRANSATFTGQPPKPNTDSI